MDSVRRFFLISVFIWLIHTASGGLGSHNGDMAYRSDSIALGSVRIYLDVPREAKILFSGIREDGNYVKVGGAMIFLDGEILVGDNISIIWTNDGDTVFDSPRKGVGSLNIKEKSIRKGIGQNYRLIKEEYDDCVCYILDFRGQTTVGVISSEIDKTDTERIAQITRIMESVRIKFSK